MEELKTLSDALRRFYSSKITKEELRKLLQTRVLGKVTGVIGPFVLRYHKGNLIISNRPLYFQKSMTEAAILGRKNFAAKVKFARFLYAEPDIKEIWNSADIAGKSAWNKLLKHSIIESILPDRKTGITPLKYHFKIDQICALEKDFVIKITTEDRFDDKFRIFMIIVPFDPVDMNDDSFSILSCSSSLGASEIKLNEDQIEICERYRKFILYTAVIHRNGDKIEWSNTVAVEGQFNENIKEAVVPDWFLIISGNAYISCERQLFIHFLSFIAWEYERHKLMKKNKLHRC